MTMTFVETAVFTNRVVRLGLEDALRELEIELAARPELGDVDPRDRRPPEGPDARSSSRQG